MRKEGSIYLRSVESSPFSDDERSCMILAAKKDSRVRGIEIRRIGEGRSILVLAYDAQPDNHL